MTETKPPGKTWDEAMDLNAAGRVLEALDDPEPEEPTNDAEDGPFPSIEGYIFDCRLGGGGGGEVYRAVRIGSDRPLAIKILNQRIGETPEARRAWRELDVLEQLRLPCLPRLIDHGIHDGRMFLAMEFIEGHPLIEHCRINDLDRPARVELLAKVADAVQSLHERGVMHRDIKPSNILIDPSGQAVLIDLGIAALLSRSAAETLTKDGAPIGSPAYMAPEQARGEKEAISTRSDVYGLGATGYILLTGDTPHDMDATLHEAIRRVAQDEPRHPRELDPTLPKPLAAVLAKAAAQDPDRRYTSPADFARDLRRWLNREPVEAGGISLPQRLGRLVGRHPIMTTAAACIIVATSIFVATYVSVWFLNSRPHSLSVDDDRRVVRLLSPDGRILHKWSTSISGTIRGAHMISRPAGLGSGRVIILAFYYDQETTYSGSLCVFDADGDWDQPVWQMRLADTDLPDRLLKRDAVGADFGVRFCQIYDIFPDQPGLEIVTAFQHSETSCLLRIVDLSGRTLYQRWHDGNIIDAYWMSDARLLVSVGRNGEAFWPQRGHPEADSGRHPLVVFALKPTLGDLDERWISPADALPGSELVWYRAFLPPALADQLGFVSAATLIAPSSQQADGRAVRVRLRAAQDADRTLAVNVDQWGRIVPGSLATSNEYAVAGDRLPSPKLLYLEDLPPLIDDTAAESDGPEPRP